jgi:CubicO group peptidase (beta-lactamase class C family)
MTHPRLFLAAAACAWLSACGGGGGDGSGNPEPLPVPPAPAAGVIGDGRLPELIEWARASQNAPALAVVMVRRGQIAEIGAAGRRSADNTISVTNGDRWQIGSMTKAMTATLAAILVEDGSITWETTPVDVWPELANTIHPAFRNVTLRQFLSHTSGMKRDDDFGPAADSAAGTPMQKRRAWAEHLLTRAPEGTAGVMSYSNVGYMVAGAMIETRAGSPWETSLTTRVFAPLGMTRTGFGAPGTPGAIDEPLGHFSRNGGFDPISPGSAEANIPAAVGPAGNVHTTLEDYARFMQAHIAGARGIPGLLTADSFQTLQRPVASNYALGWGHTDNFPALGVPGVSHSGSTGRWFSVVWLAPSLDAGVMVVTNGGGDRGSAAVEALEGLMARRLAATP